MVGVPTGQVWESWCPRRTPLCLTSGGPSPLRPLHPMEAPHPRGSIRRKGFSSEQTAAWAPSSSLSSALPPPGPRSASIPSFPPQLCRDSGAHRATFRPSPPLPSMALPPAQLPPAGLPLASPGWAPPAPTGARTVTRRVPGGHGGQPLPLQQHGPTHAQLGQVVEGLAAQAAPADDHHAGCAGQGPAWAPGRRRGVLCLFQGPLVRHALL